MESIYSINQHCAYQYVIPRKASEEETSSHIPSPMFREYSLNAAAHQDVFDAVLHRSPTKITRCNGAYLISLDIDIRMFTYSLIHLYLQM